MLEENKEKPIVILISAGTARRLYPLTINTPKCLLELEKNTLLIDYQLKMLIENGIKEVKIIVGFEASKIIEHVKSYSKKINIECFYNPFYDITNNFASLWLFLNQFSFEDCITINGDNIFTSNVIKHLITSSGDIVVTINDKDKFDDDDMKVLYDKKSKLLLKISKLLDKNIANAESIGIIKYNKKGLKLLKNQMDSLLLYDNNYLNKFYLSAIQHLVNNGENINIHKTNEQSWREIDYVEDYHKLKSDIANKIFYF